MYLQIEGANNFWTYNLSITLEKMWIVFELGHEEIKIKFYITNFLDKT